MEMNEDARVFKIRRNLLDAGCDDSLIAQFLELEQKRRRKEQYRLLSKRRASLLDRLHQEQYKIDCLDHMVYTMEKEDMEKQENNN